MILNKKWFLIAVIVIELMALAAAMAQQVQLTREQLINQIQDKVHEQEKELEFAEKKAKEARDNSDRTHEELGRAQGQIDQVGKERDAWHQYGDDQHDKWMNAETRVAKEQAAVLRRNIIIIGLVLLIGLYVVAKIYFKAQLPFL
jgi:septal ring factor EnvC (AmiA/AmiB activator)